jgi:hypothetical protein
VGNAKVGVSHEFVVDMALVYEPKYEKVSIFIFNNVANLV